MASQPTNTEAFARLESVVKDPTTSAEGFECAWNMFVSTYDNKEAFDITRPKDEDTATGSPKRNTTSSEGGGYLATPVKMLSNFSNYFSPPKI